MVPGMGVEFTGVSAERLEEIEHFVQKLRHDLDEV
jgi:hypothetical protein